MDRAELETIMQAYQSRYSEILNRIWPTIGSNGFAEHNQTGNFTFAYEAVANERRQDTSVWYEFQIPNGIKNNHRIDGLIINYTTKELLLVEAKRFSKNNLPKKRRELADDLLRIRDLNMEVRCKDLFVKKNEAFEYSVYGVLLFDLWTETKEQKDFCREWKAFCETREACKLTELFMLTEKEIDLLADTKDCFLPTITEIKSDRWKDKDYSYYLGALLWKESAITCAKRSDLLKEKSADPPAT